MSELKIKRQLRMLYPEQSGDLLLEITRRFSDFKATRPNPSISDGKKVICAKDICLITYGDAVTCSDKSPLKSLNNFLDKYGDSVFQIVHILPCFPFSSDDGFSIKDYKSIDSKLGTWDDLAAISQTHDVMLDAVVNHISSQSYWFQQYLEGNPRYGDFFIEADPTEDYSQVTRPRTLPLLTEYRVGNKRKHLWTTFSEDQIDLNYRNPEVLLAILDVLLFYTLQGVRIIRLDAIGFIWKKRGTSCMHLAETHGIIQIIRQVVDYYAPGTLLITETNVPHDENISYFGNGHNEAHLVYQFPLPPLVLNSIITGNATKLTRWAQNLTSPVNGCTFLNFLASHDGIGLRAVEGILNTAEIERLVQVTLDRGGLVSYKKNSDGSKSPYELNISYLDAVSNPEEDTDTRVKIMVAAHAILLSIQGVPAIYFQSFVGSGNDILGFKKSGISRRFNRKKFSWKELSEKLENPNSLESRVQSVLVKLIKIRKKHTLFSPYVDQKILSIHPSLFTVKRFDSSGCVLCVTNVSNNKVVLENPLEGFDLITGSDFKKNVLLPYETIWSKK